MKQNINPNIIGSADKWALQIEKGLIANNERVLFAVAELKLPRAKRRRPSARRVRNGLFIRVVNFHSDLSLFKEKFFYNWLKI